MRGNYYGQMVLGIKPARHRAVNKLAAKTINGRGYEYSLHPGVGKKNNHHSKARSKQKKVV